jgi:radical SAM protein (TIGR01212 family)
LKWKKKYNNSIIRYRNPYNLFGDYLQKKYSSKVFKVPINAHLSCPNRDGTKGYSGCIFCSDGGSAIKNLPHNELIYDQMKNISESFNRTGENVQYIAYLQAFSNTYADVSTLEKIYDTAVSFPDTVGLMIGTRPDCINRDILKLISKYKKENFELWIELGIQSMNEKSVEFLNRKHSVNDSIDAINLISEYNIPICVHVILGIPDETWENMMYSAVQLSKLPINGIKIHHMHVIKGTEFEQIYKNKKFPLFAQKEYISTVCDFIERLRSDIIIHRLMGDCDIESLIFPRWSIHKGTILQGIEDEFARRSTYQGFLHEGEIL